MYNGGYDLPTDVNSTDFFNSLGNMAAGLVVLVVILGLIALAVGIFLIIAQCKVYKKAG